MAAWIAVGCTVLLWIVIIVKQYGYDEARMHNIEEEQKRSFRYHEEHFQHAKDDQVHFKDMELHWSSRERDELNRRMDRQDEKQEEILREIRSLGARMYDK